MIWFYALSSVVLVSLISLIGVFTLSIRPDRLKPFLIYAISFSAGALLGNAFLHLLPELIEETPLSMTVSLYIISGIAISFIIEKLIYWRHCHLPTTDAHPHPFAMMNLLGDAVHNFIDGLVIGAAYLVSIPVGIATTVAVILHEIPQEIGDLGILMHGGFSRGKALLVNFGTALLAVIGATLALVLHSYSENITFVLIPFAIGGFIYIAAADLIPELHKEVRISKSLAQIFWFLLGVGLMVGLV